MRFSPVDADVQDCPLSPPSQEQENRDLLERFRMACTRSEQQEQQLQEAEGFSNSIRLELLVSDTDRRRLRESVSNQEREIQQVGGRLTAKLL